MPHVFIIFGQTGLKKEQYLINFRDYLDKFHRGRGPSVRIVKFEDHLVNRDGKKFSNLAWRSKGISNRDKLEIWQRSFGRLINDANTWTEDYIFLEMHAIHYVHGSFYSYIIPESLKEINPRAIIVLMDDLIGIYNNIDHKKLEEEQHGLVIEHRELIYWRALEFHVSEHLPRYIPNCPSYWLAIRSHPETLRKLLENEIDKRYKKVYISFPITATKSSADHRQEIDEFRSKIYEIDGLTVFDPVAIDDLRWLAPDSEPKDVFERWPLGELHYALCPYLSNKENIPESFLKNYYYVKRQIDERDLILVRQSDALLVYRPLFNGIVAAGCMAEIREAAKQGSDIIAYIPNEDSKKAVQNPFKSAVISDYIAVETIANRDVFFERAMNLCE